MKNKKQKKTKETSSLSGNKVYLLIDSFSLDTFQDFLIAVHMKPHMDLLEISISSLNHVIVRPTKTPKSAVKKFAQIY